MAHIQVKIHDVMHDPRPDNPQLSLSEIETRIEHSTLRGDRLAVQNVQILSGHQNSPILIELEASNLTPDIIKTAATQAVREFATHVDGVNIENTVRDDNIRIQNIDE